MTQRRFYQEEFPYFVTFRTMEGYPLFKKTKYAALLACVLFRSCTMKGYILYAYCIMPDHVHLLASHSPNQCSHRTLEKVRWELGEYPSHTHPQSTLSRVRMNKRVQMNKTHNVSEFMQSKEIFPGWFIKVIFGNADLIPESSTTINIWLRSLITLKIIPSRKTCPKNTTKCRINILIGAKLSRYFLTKLILYSKLIIPEDRSFQNPQNRRFFMEGVTRLGGNFPLLEVDYDQPIEDMIKAAGFTKFPEKIPQEYFQSDRKKGKKKVHFLIFYITDEASTTTILKELKKEKIGLRPATLIELVTFAAKYKEFHETYMLFALGSAFDKDGKRLMADVHKWYNSIWALSIMSHADDMEWTHVCLFLIVREH